MRGAVRPAAATAADYAWAGEPDKTTAGPLISWKTWGTRGLRSRVPHCAPVRAFLACMAGGMMPASIRLLRRGGGGVTQPKCGAPTETGGRCKRPADVGSGQCFKHQGAWTAKARAQRKKKEAAAKMQELRKKKWSWW